MFNLDNRSGSSQTELLERIHKARHPEPDQSEPTDNVEAEASDDAPVEEVEAEAHSVEVEAESTESELSTEETEAQEEPLYIDLDGEEVSLEDVKKWKSGHMMDADYRRKTMALADERKKFEAERQEFNSLAEELKSKKAELEAAIKLDEEGVDWEELREYEPERYIEMKEKLEKRKKLASEISSRIPEQKPQTFNVQEEQKKLFESHPDWIKDGKPTEVFQKDSDTFYSYVKKHGFSQAEANDVLSANLFNAVLKAAKYDELKEKSDKVKKQVRKAPLTTKPKQSGKTSLQSQYEDALAKLKRTGKPEDAVAVKRLKRQLRGN